MFSFPLFSILMFIGYVALLQAIPVNLNGAYMIGVSFDLPLVIAIFTAVFVRNTPLAVFLTLLSVVLVVEFVGLNQMYRVHAPIAYTFLCIFVSRIIALVRRRPLSDLVKDSNWINKKFSIPKGEWNWTERANSTVDKLTKIFDAITLMLFMLIALSSVEYAVITYSVLWLGYFALFVSPILFIERLSRLMNSAQKNVNFNYIEGDALQRAEQRAEKVKAKVTRYKDDAKSWIKTGFDDKNQE